MFNAKVKFSLLLLLAALCFSAAEPLAAQEQPPAWAQQQRIPGYSDRTEPPILLPDSTGVIHAFAYQELNEPGEMREVGIVYSQWSYEDGWTTPVDIILSPIKRQARVMDVYLDPQGYFHLIFYGGDEEEAYIFYSTAHLSEAGQASAWKRPAVIGERPLTPSLAKIAGDGLGNLRVLYSGNLDGPGLFMISSANNGENWHDVEPFFLTYNRFHRAAVINWRWGASGKLHLVWQIGNDVGQNVAGYYAQADAQMENWTAPISIDEGIGADQGMGVANPAVIEHEGLIIIAYNNGIPPVGVPPTNWMRASADNGQTWTERIRISQEHVGRNGLLSFVVDSENQLRLFFGLRVPTSGIEALHGMWHTVWQNGRWSRSEAVVSAPGGRGFDPYDARAAVALGNRLLLTWRTDPGNAQPGVWYSYTLLNGPTLEAAAVPTPQIADNGAPAEGQTSEARPSQIALLLTPVPFTNVEEAAVARVAMSEILLWAIIPVLILVGVVVGVYWRRGRRV
jgi:hypothetical protein